MMKYSLDKNKICISIGKGELVNASILNVAMRNKVEFGWVNGIGAISDPEIGFYDIENKEYIKKIVPGHFELVSLQGNLTYKDDELFIHSHIAFTDVNFQAYGGHLFDCKIAVAGEFIIFNGQNKLSRNYDDGTGLFLWDCKI